MPNYDFQLELRLRRMDRALADRQAGCMALFEQMLKKFRAVFPNFTDHTLLHSLNVINISNQLLRDEAEKLNAEEIYISLMATALHDIGMGTQEKDFDSLIAAIGQGDYLENHPELSKSDAIRIFHHDLSAEFIKKYWEIFEIPNDRYAYAIAEVARGHRKTCLMDREQYPEEFDLGDGKCANLPQLAAILRLADELDVASDRNPEILYNSETMENLSGINIFEFSKHKAIHSVDFTEEAIVISADTDQEALEKGILDAVGKIAETRDYCISVLQQRSSIRLNWTELRLTINGREIRF